MLLFIVAFTFIKNHKQNELTKIIPGTVRKSVHVFNVYNKKATFQKQKYGI